RCEMTSTTAAFALTIATGLLTPRPDHPSGMSSTPKAAQDAPVRSADPDVSLTGCLFDGEVPSTFILYNAKKDPQDPYEMGGTYLLVSSAGLFLKSHVTH